MPISAIGIGSELEEKIEEFQKRNWGIPELNDENIAQILTAAKIDVNEEIEANPVCIQLSQNGHLFTWGTLGNFSAIIGKAKSRKSFLIMIAIAAALKNSLFNFISVHFALGNDHILFFDTEQSRYHVQRSVKRILSLSGTPQPKNLSTYGLRRFSAAERLKLIEYAIYNTEGLALVIIDGIRDLVTSINDEEQATMITSKLLKWTEERGIHIIIVLHQNKGDNNARGHVGSEIINKAETVSSVTKDADNKDVSIVQSEYCRDKDFEPFAFQIDEYGLPFIDENCIIKGEEKKKSFTHLDIPKETHRKILTEIFAFNPTPTYSELVALLKNVLTKHCVKAGGNKIKEFVTYYQTEKLIIKDSKPRYPVYRYQSV